MFHRKHQKDLLSSNDWWNIQSARCTLKTAYTIYIENVKTLEIGKDIRGIMCESMWCYQTREIIERLFNQLLLKQRTQKPVINAMMAADQEYRSSIKSAGWMPWHWEPMKDVISCEKLRGAANEHWSGDIRMGKPGTAIPYQRAVNQIAVRREPPELKHLSRARKRHQQRFR